jgi:hypothetical protein
MKDQRRLGLEDSDLKLLNRPDWDTIEDESDSEMDVDRDMDAESATDAAMHDPTGTMGVDDFNEVSTGQYPRPHPWLDRDCISPPMPFDKGTFAEALIDPDGIVSDDAGNPVLLTSKNCCSFLKRGEVPRLALANYNFLGPVPPELTNLTVIEEAMIARCRAKCWVIQLKEEGDYSTPITQRGVRGHFIIYPQRPSDIAALQTLEQYIEN